MQRIIAIFITVLSFNTLVAQDYKFGKVSIEELTKNTYEKDTTANAVVLYKNRKTYLSYEHPDNWVVVNEIHKRVKILKKDGFDYCTEKVRLYNNQGDKEKITGIKGITYSLENGKLKKDKLKKSEIFKTEISKNYKQHSFTMPNVQVGSVVEWTYKTISPFWKIDDLVIQEDIPTDYYLAKIQVPDYFKFKKNIRGGFTIYPKEYKERRKMKVSYEESGNRYERSGSMKEGGGRNGISKATQTGEIDILENFTEYDLIDIPALKREPYVNNLNNYRLMVNYELMSVMFPQGDSKVFSTTWNDVIKTINDHGDFGKQLKKVSFLKDDASGIKNLTTNQEELSARAFNFIQNKMSWNGNYGKYCDKGIQKAYSENAGNVAEINLMLVALLRECGVTANPVLISTRKHGIPLFPTLEGFNYVVACAEINGQEILMDATEKILSFGLLPNRAINWEGTLVLGNGTSRKIKVFPNKPSKNDVMMTMEIDEDGNVKGKRRASMTDLEAFSFRKYSRDNRIESIKNNQDLLEISDYETKNGNVINKPVIETYTFDMEDAVDIVGDEIYFSPLLDLALDENPFKSEDRIYPVDFVYPVSRKKMVTITIPEGYSITSIPKPIKLSLPNNMGSFLFNIQETSTGLNLVTDFKINTSIVPTQNYIELKEFYNQRVLKETEKIVLTKN